MQRLESNNWWSDLLGLKDELSLRELSDRFGVTPGAISAALKRTGTRRRPAPPGPRVARAADDDLPPEAGAGTTAASDGGGTRPGSKDHLVETHRALLGNVPDAEVAKMAGVSVRTIASFRARHSIGGYAGPRRAPRQGKRRASRIDPFEALLGAVADRIVAEKAGVSLNAVRNYRVKRGIPAAGARGRAAQEKASPAVEVAAVASESKAPKATGVTTPVKSEVVIRVSPELEAATPIAVNGFAWRVTWQNGPAEDVRVVVAPTLVEAASRAERARVGGHVVSLTRLAEVLA